MTNLDHGKFRRVTTTFHSLLALDVFFLFFSGYSMMFNDELWWLVTLMGGNSGVLAVHRLAGFLLVVLTVFWVVLMVVGPHGGRNLRAALPNTGDVAAFVQDVRFALGSADERHPQARQFAGYSADDVPLLSYVGKGVLWIFTVELVLLMVSGVLIWNKVGLMEYFATRTAVMAFVTFHGLLGVIMLMGVMFHIYEHGFHPAFYPVELKAFIPKSQTPSFHGEAEEEVVERTEVVDEETGEVVERREVVETVERDPDDTGIELLQLRPSWNWAANLMGVLVVVGILSVLIASVFDEGYPVPRELVIGGGPTNLLLAVGINVGILVLFVGLLLSVYGNVLRGRYERQVRERRRAVSTDGGEADD